MVSIFTLNLWRYYDFDLRLPNIKKTINDKKPDIIFLQEVQIDPSVIFDGYRLSYDYKPYLSYPKDNGCLVQ